MAYNYLLIGILLFKQPIECVALMNNAQAPNCLLVEIFDNLINLVDKNHVFNNIVCKSQKKLNISNVMIQSQTIKVNISQLHNHLLLKSVLRIQALKT